MFYCDSVWKVLLCFKKHCFPEHIFAFKHLLSVRGASLLQCLRFPQKLPQNVFKYFFTYCKYPILWLLLLLFTKSKMLVYRYETCDTSYWFTRCCCLSAAPCLCLLPRQSQRWVAALNLKCISTSKALGKLLLFYTAFACLEDQEPRLLTFFSFSMNNYSRIWDSWYTSLLHSLPVPTCLRPLFCNISIYFEQRLKTK